MVYAIYASISRDRHPSDLCSTFGSPLLVPPSHHHSLLTLDTTKSKHGSRRSSTSVLPRRQFQSVRYTRHSKTSYTGRNQEGVQEVSFPFPSPYPSTLAFPLSLTLPTLFLFVSSLRLTDWHLSFTPTRFSLALPHPVPNMPSNNSKRLVSPMPFSRTKCDVGNSTTLVLQSS